MQSQEARSGHATAKPARPGGLTCRSCRCAGSRPAAGWLRQAAATTPRPAHSARCRSARRQAGCAGWCPVRRRDPVLFSSWHAALPTPCLAGPGQAAHRSGPLQQGAAALRGARHALERPAVLPTSSSRVCAACSRTSLQALRVAIPRACACHHFHFTNNRPCPCTSLITSCAAPSDTVCWPSPALLLRTALPHLTCYALCGLFISSMYLLSCWQASRSTTPACAALLPLRPARAWPTHSCHLPRLWEHSISRMLR